MLAAPCGSLPEYAACHFRIAGLPTSNCFELTSTMKPSRIDAAFCAPFAARLVGFFLVGLAWQAGQMSAQAADSPRAQTLRASRPNVLLILIDDLKPTLGCYGDELAITPNIDRLATRGLRFDLAYCNHAICSASRFNLMLGSHSSSTGLYSLGQNLREFYPDAVTLPQHFAAHGYRTESMGKVFHIGHGNLGDPQSFMAAHFHDKVIEYLDPASTQGGRLTREEAMFTNQHLDRARSLPRGAAYEWPDVPDDAYADGRVANYAVQRLQAARQLLDQKGEPFFIAVGFVRPHLPFSAPRRYWDMYDRDAFALPSYEQLPEGAPEYAGKDGAGGELRNYFPVPEEGDLSDDLKRTLIHGYYASTTYADAQIGKVLDELDRLELADSTIVLLWGDHGYHLGDLGMWTKHTNYEQANRIPLLVVAPGVTEAESHTRHLVSSVDIYPTLAELAGLPAPSGPQPIDGISLVPVLKDPRIRLRDHAFHLFPRQKMGRSIRTERFRLVEWRNRPAERREGERAVYELYDYQDDPWETRNLAGDRPAVVGQLKAILDTYPLPVIQGQGRRQGD